VALPAVLARRTPQSRYNRRISEGLSEAWRSAGSRTVDVDSIRAVVFSDHHRGQGDGADDFRRCEDAYCAALGWYRAHDFELWLLGDVEELWENRPRQVLDRYSNVLELEREFGDELWRFYGNHDMSWRRKKNVERFLADRLPSTTVSEALRVVVTDQGSPLGTLFLTHGHQGTIDSGNALVVPVSRFVVRTIWGGLQRLRGFANTSPANDAVLRSKHDRAMAKWADEHPERVILITGHTHHPVFPGTHPPDLEAQAAAAEARYQSALATGSDIAGARAARELARVRATRAEPYSPPDLNRPCYFNTGCCSFGDGDITGLEINEGKIRLVRWLEDAGGAVGQELEAVPLRQVLAGVAGAPPKA
jgi:UDP-2,3-diacylglucosamine pyrophosphatase LpxH